MRIAASAVAAASGLFLLGLAFYGEPAFYIQQAREQWDALMDRPAADHIAEPDAQAEQATQLRQEVARLRQALAATQQALAPPPNPAEEAQPAYPPPMETAPTPRPPLAAVPAPAPLAAVPPEPAAAAPLSPALAIPEQPKPAPDATDVPERHVAAAEPLKPSASAKPVAAPRPAPTPPPPVMPSPKHEADDPQSVLARLRQGAAPPEPQQEAQPSVPLPSPSPALAGLLAARAALARGRIEDARRLLQEAQLQLVFRPMTPDGDPAPAAGRGAADVAHALDALGANDIPLGQRYISVALGDLSGKQTNPPIQQSNRIGSGYAPAYPPR